ncbi:HD domain-containing protein, partial [Thermodesulfobacteriota bacterium]
MKKPLHDIGIVEAEKKYNSTAPAYQHKEGPPIAKEILIKLGAREELIEEVCDIIGHHHQPRDDDSLNFKVVYDADLVENSDEMQKDNPIDAEKMAARIKKMFLTRGGREV